MDHKASWNECASHSKQEDFTAVLVQPTEPAGLPRLAQTFPGLEVQLLQATEIGNASKPRYSPQDIAQVRRAHHILLWTTAGEVKGGGGEGRMLDQHMLSCASLADHLGQPLRTVLVMLLHSIKLFGHIRDPNVTQDEGLRKLKKNELLALVSEAGLPVDIVEVLWNWQSCTNVPRKTGALSEKEKDCLIFRALNDIDEIVWDVHLRGPPKVSHEEVDQYCVSLARINASRTFCDLLRASRARTEMLREQLARNGRLAAISEEMQWRLQPNKRAAGGWRNPFISVDMIRDAGTVQAAQKAGK